MMTEQEYKKNLIRMWDSLRIKHKGGNGCSGVVCRDCPLYEEVCRADINTVLHSYKAIEIVKNWAKEHPIITNTDKFREVFGTEPSKHTCVNVNIQCEDCKYLVGGCCAASTKFWDAEYEEKAKGVEENRK